MGRVTELRVRADWGLVRFAYLPLLVAGLAAARFLPFVGVVLLRAAPCAVCYLMTRWVNHIEEWTGAKPILQITDQGLTCEDGEEAVEYGWSEIVGVVMHRRNPVPLWRTGGALEIAPPYWLSVSVRDSDYQSDDGAVFEETSRYVDRRRRPEGADEAEAEGVRSIILWPRQVRGGLFSLMRFAKELQLQLLDRAHRGEIPRLLPEGTE